jgi:hypothetical protein
LSGDLVLLVKVPSAQTRIVIALGCSTLMHLVALHGIVREPPADRVVFAIDVRLLPGLVDAGRVDPAPRPDPAIPEAEKPAALPEPLVLRPREVPAQRAPVERSPDQVFSVREQEAARGRPGGVQLLVSVFETVEPAVPASLRVPDLAIGEFRTWRELSVPPEPLAPIEPVDPRRRGAPLARVDVRLLVLIDETGRVVAAPGFENDPDAGNYEAAAREAVLTAKYTPPEIAGRRVKARIPMMFRFGYE